MSWADVQEAWREREEEIWKPHFEERGFSDWWSWRQTYLDDLGIYDKKWTLERVENPLAIVPGWFVGGYHGWKQYVPREDATWTFADIAVSPKLKENPKVMRLVGNFKPTRLIVLTSNGKTAVVDGTHRAAAIALMAKEGGFTVPPIEIDTVEVSSDVFERFCLSRPRVRLNASKEGI